MISDDSLIECLRNSLPITFGRSSIDKLMPGVINSKSLANLQSKGLGPKSYRLGKKKVFYDRENFLLWLSSNITIIAEGNICKIKYDFTKRR